MPDVKAKFRLVMRSLHLHRQLESGDTAWMSFVRGQNNLKSKKIMIEQDGTATMNERVEMQTMIQHDEQSGFYKPKMAQFNAYLNDTLIGRAQVNLADFVKDGKVTNRYALFDDSGQDAVAPLDSHENVEHMVLEVTTGGKGSDSQNRPASKVGMSRGKLDHKNAASDPLKMEIKMMEATVDKLKKDIAEKEHQNNEIVDKLQDLGYKEPMTEKRDLSQKDAILASIGDRFEMQVKQKRNNTEIYQKITDVDDQMIKQLVKLDQDLDRLFEIQMKKGNKNNEMIRNKIQRLNEKPSLRKCLFKQIATQELEKDLQDEERKLAMSYDII